MEVKINREIRDYMEAIFFGLSFRQFVFSLAAVLISVGLYFLLRPYFGVETLSWICILGATPFAAMGFVKYNGMTAEKLVWVWFYSEFLMPKKLVFKSTNLYAEILSEHLNVTTEGGKRRENHKKTVKVGSGTDKNT